MLHKWYVWREDALQPVVEADTVVDIWTVVIKRQYTAITLSTMFSPQRFHRPTRVTETAQWVWWSLLAPVFKPRCLDSQQSVNLLQTTYDTQHDCVINPQIRHYTVSQTKTSKIVFVITLSNFHQLSYFLTKAGKQSKIIWGALISHLT